MHQAAIATELQDKLTRKNEQACVKVARDASLLEDIESEIKELMEQPLFQTKQGVVVCPEPERQAKTPEMCQSPVQLILFSLMIVVLQVPCSCPNRQLPHMRHVLRSVSSPLLWRPCLHHC